VPQPNLETKMYMYAVLGTMSKTHRPLSNAMITIRFNAIIILRALKN